MQPEPSMELAAVIRTKAANGTRRAQVFAALRQAGAPGLTLQQIVELVDKTLMKAHNLMAYYEAAGQVWRYRVNGVLHYVLTEVRAPAEGEAIVRQPRVKKSPKPARVPKAPKAESKAPKLEAVRPLKALERALKRAGLMPQSAADSMGPKAVKLARDDQVIVPEHVKVTRCPGLGYDPRFQVDDRTFNGGERTAEWRARRAGATHD